MTITQAPTQDGGFGRRLEQLTRHPATKVVAGGTLLWSVWNASDEGTVWCPFRRCTGGYCPGCGATRSAGRFLRGDISGSWAQHPIVVFVAAQVLALGLFLSFMPRLRSDWRRFVKPLAIINGGALVPIWAWRLLDGSIPVPFG